MQAALMFFEKIHAYFFLQLTIGILLLWVLSKAIDFSLDDIISGLLDEIKSFQSGTLSKSALNAFGCTLIFLFLILAAFKDTFKELLELVSQASSKSSERADIMPLGLFILAFTLVLSILFCKKD